MVKPVSRVGPEPAAGESRTSVTFPVTPQLSFSQLLPKHWTQMTACVRVYMCDRECDLRDVPILFYCFPALQYVGHTNNY